MYKALVVNKITGVTDAVVVKLFPMPFNQKKSVKNKITDILRTEMAVIQKMKSPFVVEYRAYAEIQYPDYPGNRWYRALIIKQEDMSFDQFIQRHMQLTDEQYFEKMRPIFKQLVLAYTAIHAENIIHRDVKPDNILVSITASGEAQVKVCDFGLSKFQETLAKGTEVSRACPCLCDLCMHRCKSVFSLLFVAELNQNVQSEFCYRLHVRGHGAQRLLVLA